MTTDPSEYISGRTVQEQMNELISYVDTRAAEVSSEYASAAEASAEAAAQSAEDAATTLANAVTISDAQTITGLKTFSKRTINTSGAGYWTKDSDIDWTATPASTQNSFETESFDANDVEMHKSVVIDDTDSRRFEEIMSFYDTNSTQKEAILSITADRTEDTAEMHFYNGDSTVMVVGDTVTVPTPGSGAGSTEVTTVGYVSDTGGSLNNLVHTSSAETIAGVKTFTSEMDLYSYRPTLKMMNSISDVSTTPSANVYNNLTWVDKDGDSEGGLTFLHKTDGVKRADLQLIGESGTNAALQLIVDSAGTVTLVLKNNTAGTSTTIATL